MKKVITILYLSLLLGLGACIPSKDASNPVPSESSLDFNQAKNLYDLGRYAEAATAFDAYIKAYPNDAQTDEASYFLARCYYQLDQFANALAQFQVYLQQYGTQSYADNAQYFYARSMHSALNAGQLANLYTYDETRVQYQKLITDYPSSNWIDDAKYQSARSFYDEARYLDAGNALYHLITNDQAFGSSNSIDAAYYYLARSMHEAVKGNGGTPVDDGQGNLIGYGNALNTYLLFTGSSKFSDSVYLDNAYYYIGQIHYDMNNYSDAIYQLSNFSRNFVHSSYVDNALYYRARSIHKALLLKGKTSTTSIVDPNNSANTLGYADARSAYEAVSAYQPDANNPAIKSFYHPGAQFFRAESFYDTKEFDQAAIAYSTVIPLLTDSASIYLDNAYLHYGKSLEQQTTANFTLAQTQYKAALALYTADPGLNRDLRDNIYNALAMNYHELAIAAANASGGLVSCVDEKTAIEEFLLYYDNNDVNKPNSSYFSALSSHLDEILTQQGNHSICLP